MLLKGRKNRQTYLFAGLTLLAGTWCLFPFATGLSDSDIGAVGAARLVYLVALFVPPVFLHLTFALLGLPKTKRESLLLKCSYVVSMLFIPFLPTNLFILGVIRYAPFFGVIPGPVYTAYVAFFGVTCAIGFTKLLQGYWVASGIQKNQLRYIFVSWFLAYIAGLLHFMPAYFRFEPFPHDFLVIAFVPLSYYAIIRYRLLDIRVAFTRTTIFTFVYALVLGLPFLVGYVGQEFLSVRLGRMWWLVPLVICAFFATLGPFIYIALRRRAEDRLLAEQRRYQATLRQASEGMTRIRQLPRLLKLTASILSRAMGLTHVSIYLQDGETKRYLQQVTKGKDDPSVETSLKLDDPLINYLLVHKNAIVLEELHLQRQETADPGLREVEMSLRRLGAALIIPSFVHDHLLGFVVMGAKRSGQIYSDDDIKVLMTLANQAALAIENARFYEAEKERQAEMFHTAQLASLGTMAGSMGHQINNRFHVEGIVAGAHLELLKSIDLSGMPEPTKEKIQKTIAALDKIAQDAVRGGDIVKTLLNFSRPGKMERVAFPEAIQLATELAQYRVKFEEIDFEPIVSNPLPPIDGNKNQLTEVLYNLITNAYDAIKSKEEAIKEGRVTLLAGKGYKGKIAISAAPIMKDGIPWLQAVVHDNGGGIKPGGKPK